MEKTYRYLYQDMVKELTDSEIKQLYIRAVEQVRRITETEINSFSFHFSEPEIDKIKTIKNVLKRELKRRKLIK